MSERPYSFGQVIWWPGANEEGRSQLYLVCSVMPSDRYEFVLFWPTTNVNVGSSYHSPRGSSRRYTKPLTDEQAAAYGKALLLTGVNE